MTQKNTGYLSKFTFRCNLTPIITVFPECYKSQPITKTVIEYKSSFSLSPTNLIGSKCFSQSPKKMK